MKALGMIEVYSFTTAVVAADLCAKAADVKVIAFDRNRPKSADAPAPLVMQIKIAGNVAAVKAAVEAGTEYAKAEGKHIVSHVIPNPGDGVEKMAYRLDINKDKYNKKLPKDFMNEEEINGDSVGAETIGLLEIDGLVAAIEGLDSMTKAANVRVIHSEKRLGGRLVTFIVAGEVSAVKAAVEAGYQNAQPLGKVYGKAVVARPHREVTKFFDMD
ncbi:MAG: BMC domain-containing protein [Clostridia bacterium]|nr:BMC domain-containing protein [Clostridia bacterium]